jgi:MULE transposase domain
MSLDATHMKSGSKGVMYIATVKTGLSQIYTVAFSIERANECYDGWNSVLKHLKNACSLLEMTHPMQVHNIHAYFTFVSDRDKGLVQALKDNFPKIHSTQCSIHIQSNVSTQFNGRGIQNDVYNIAKTFSFYQENKMLQKIKKASTAACNYLVGPEGI